MCVFRRHGDRAAVFTATTSVAAALPYNYVCGGREDARRNLSLKARALSDADKFAMKESRGLHNERAAGRERKRPRTEPGRVLCCCNR